jgi:hypothetical protein
MTPIQYLKELYLQENRQKFPSLPEYARTVPRYKDNDANGLTRCIIDFLKFKNHQAERVSVTGRYLANSRIFTDVTGRMRRIGSDRWIKSSMQPGTAVLSCIILGRAVKIEIKIGRDRQSEAQKCYQEQVECAGGIYLIIRTFVEFYQWYNKYIYYDRS